MRNTLVLLIAALLTAASFHASAQEANPATLAASDDWSERLQAARLLSSSPLPDDALALLTTLASDPEAAVALQAYIALARLAPDSPEALVLLTDALKGTDATRREGAGLALLRSEVPLDDALRDQALLQITSPEGRDLVDAIALRSSFREIERESRAERERHAELLINPRMVPTCVAELHARRGTTAERIEAGGELFERLWREGRYASMKAEARRFEQEARELSALNDEIEQLCYNPAMGGGGKGGGGGGGSGGGGGGGGGFWSSDTNPVHELYLKANAWIGHDNNTFLMRPGLVVTEPGVPETGQPIDLVRDDTLFGMHGQAIWRYGFGDTTLEQDDWRSLFHRGNHWLVRLEGGYDGRLRWGQLMGPTGELDVVYDRFLDEDDHHLSHLRVQALGGLFLPDWEQERDPASFPGRSVGGSLDVGWIYGLSPPGSQPWPLPTFALDYHGDVYQYVGELGVTPPETRYSNHRLQATATAGIGEPSIRRLGGVLDLALRLTEGGLAHGLTLAARAAFFTYDLADSRAEVEFGYAVGLPLGNNSESLTHTPVGRGSYVWRENGSDLYFEVRIGVERALRPTGRYGWAAVVNEGHAGIRIGGIREVTWFDLSIFGERAAYVGAARGQELSAASILLEFPLLPAEPILTTLRVDGRLAADDARFGGDLTGQFRIMMWADFSTDDLL